MAGFALIDLFVADLALLHDLKDWILYRVVTEVETFTQVDGTAKPLGEVVVANLSFVLGVFVDHQLFKVVVVKVFLVTKVHEYVLYGYITIMVHIELKEGFSHRVKAVLKFLLKSIL